VTGTRPAPGNPPTEDPTGAARAVLRRLLADGPDAWFVGGAVRERLAGRWSPDLDVAIAGDDAAGRLARAVARETSGHAFPLSDAFGAWRVTAPDAAGAATGWQVDLTPLQGSSLAEDLARRDLTVNAIAEPVRGGDPVDPHGGREDLEARRLRMVGPDAFAADPVRVLRLARFAAQLGFAADVATLAASRAAAPALADVPGERMLPELQRLFAADRWAVGWRLLVAGGAGAVLFPAAVAADGTLPEPLDPALHALLDGTPTVPEADPADRAWLADRASDPDRRLALALTLLVDDGPELRRLRPSRRLRTVVARTHDVVRLLRAAVDEDRGVDPVGWLRALRPLEADGPDAVLVARVVLGPARLPWPCLLGRAVRWVAGAPRPPIRGDHLASALGIPLGPEIGVLLERLAVEADAGTVTTDEQAIARARALQAADDEAAPG
jgi:poly(A) polymerase